MGGAAGRDVDGAGGGGLAGRVGGPDGGSGDAPARATAAAVGSGVLGQVIRVGRQRDGWRRVGRHRRSGGGGSGAATAVGREAAAPAGRPRVAGRAVGRHGSSAAQTGGAGTGRGVRRSRRRRPWQQQTRANDGKQHACTHAHATHTKHRAAHNPRTQTPPRLAPHAREHTRAYTRTRLRLRPAGEADEKCRTRRARGRGGDGEEGVLAPCHGHGQGECEERARWFEKRRRTQKEEAAAAEEGSAGHQPSGTARERTLPPTPDTCGQGGRQGVGTSLSGPWAEQGGKAVKGGALISEQRRDARSRSARSPPAATIGLSALRMRRAKSAARTDNSARTATCSHHLQRAQRRRF